MYFNYSLDYKYLKNASVSSKLRLNGLISPKLINISLYNFGAVFGVSSLNMFCPCWKNVEFTFFSESHSIPNPQPPKHL